MDIEYANKILEILNKDKECSEWLSMDHHISNSEDDVWDTSEVLHKALRNNNIENFALYSGATKNVIVFEDRDFVIKIPMDCKLEYDEEEEDNIVVDFKFAGIHTEISNCWDYCEVETVLYDMATEEKLNEFFAEARLLGCIKGRPIYIQELAISYGNGGSSNSKPSEYAEITASTVIQAIKKESHYSLPKDWVCAAIDLYGIDELLKLADFIGENHITDLHHDNIGFNNDGLPVIIDYSSYNEH